MSYYKILQDGKSCNNGNLTWSLPKEDGTPGDWHSVEGELVPCSHGIHLATEPYQRWFPFLDCDVYIAEPGEIVIPIDDDKIVTEKARLLRKLETPSWLSKTREFVSSFSEIPWMVNDRNPNPEWKLFEMRNDVWDAAWDAARDAAWVAGRDAARVAAWVAGRDAARVAAWVAVRDAAWVAGRDAARVAAWVAVRDAVRDAGLFAQCLIVKDALDPVQFEHVKKRMEVWQKGYGLCCEVDGVLYVYKRD